MRLKQIRLPKLPSSLPSPWCPQVHLCQPQFIHRIQQCVFSAPLYSPSRCTLHFTLHITRLCSFTSMDPEGDIVPSNNASRAHRSTQSIDRSSHTSPLPVILRISPTLKGEQFGYIHLTPGERTHQETIQAHFDSACREVITLPCPNFEEFLLANSFRTCNVSFLCDLPEYILRLGRRILKDTTASMMAILTFYGYPIPRL